MKVFIKNMMIIGVVFILLGTILMPAVGINTRSLTSDEICIAGDVQKISQNGHTLYVGGSGPNNYSKIQDAIDNASDGDTVFVYDDSSPYYENIKVNKSINLIGENRNNTIIDGGESGNVVNVTADWVNITGFTLQYSANNWYDVGIEMHSNCTKIFGNNIWNNNRGIYLFYSSKNKISDNKIYFNKYDGIFLWHSSNNNISGNNIYSNNQEGIALWKGSNNTVVSDNNISSNGAGIVLLASGNNKILDNRILDNKYEGIWLHYLSYNNKISGNDILNDTCGIGLCSLFNIFSGNNISSNNHTGIFLDCSLYNKIYGNNITNNGVGIELSTSFANDIYHNNFIENDLHAFFIESFLNRWNENYWDNWIGIGPKIIVGKIWIIHYKYFFVFIPWLNFDWHPLTEPYGGG